MGRDVNNQSDKLSAVGRVGRVSGLGDCYNQAIRRKCINTKRMPEFWHPLVGSSSCNARSPILHHATFDYRRKLTVRKPFGALAAAGGAGGAGASAAGAGASAAGASAGAASQLLQAGAPQQSLTPQQAFAPQQSLPWQP